MGTPDGVGRYNHFSKGGSIYWTAATGAHEVHGNIRAEWAATGWETGPTGYPVTDELGTPDGVGRFNHFSKGGSIYLSLIHISEPTRLLSISYAVFCLTKTKDKKVSP